MRIFGAVSAIAALALLIFGKASLASTPFVQGTVNGRWIGAVLQAGGASGNVYIVPVYAQNAGQVSKIGELSQSDVTGGTISALFFAHDKMYVTDDLALPGECQACHDYAVVRRFAVVRGGLRQEAVGVVRYPRGGADDARFRNLVLEAPLQNTPGGPEVGALPEI